MIANFEVATGQVVAPSLGASRTEEDFAAHIAQTIEVDPEAEWIFITDQLNTPICSAGRIGSQRMWD